MMADKLLNDRQDVPIWNAVEAGNFKQALKLVDKRLAKKRTPHLEVCVNGEISLLNISLSRDWGILPSHEYS